MSNEEKKTESSKEEKKKKAKERLKEYIEKEFGVTIENETSNEESEKELIILGIPVLNDRCYKLLIGRYVVIGKVISRTKSIITIEDIFGKHVGIQVSKINLIGEIDCESLDDIRTQLERRKKKKR
jgi:hypothetical protein